ncbi:MAG TPA: hypothetical protein VJ724_13680 [Tahibacter sp.]|nr:hypothetical protein [Tahibacter sp.]
MPFPDLDLPTPRRWLALAGLLIALKLVVGLADPTVRFFLGDSESYLHSALTGWMPPDRSFVYPWLLRASAVAFASLAALVVVQSLAGVATALLTAWLALALGVAPRVAAVAAVLVALDPAQLFYERMVMAESVGTLCFVAMIACGVASAARREARWLVPMALAGALTVALRMSLLPVVLGFALVPSFALLVASRQWRRVALHATVALVATGLAQHAYQRLYGYVADTEPTYLRASGTFRLGLVAPLVRPEHLERYGLPRDLAATLGPDLANPRLREQQLWLPDGLVMRLKALLGDERAEVVARKLAARALHDDVPGFLAMQAGNLADYFEPAITAPRLEDDLGVRPLSDAIRTAVRDAFGYDASTVHDARNPVARAFLVAAPPWLTFCLFALAPLALVAVVRSPRERRAATIAFALAACGLVAGHVLFSHIVSYRYLHPFAPLTLVALAAAFTRRDGRSTSATTRS